LIAISKKFISGEIKLVNRHLGKILLFGFAGMILGLFWSWSLLTGYFKAWEKLSPPPSTIVELVTVGDAGLYVKTIDNSILRCSNWRNECWVKDKISENSRETRITKPCNFSSPEFSPIKRHPENISDCIQGVTQYVEGNIAQTFVLDNVGNIWEWNNASSGFDPLAAIFITFCSSSLGIVLGIIFFVKKRKDLN
jgi:hypothetical protein